MDHGLIYDIGMHRGDDTAFYLKKGFRVVAIEANPRLCEAGRERFAREIREGRLTIVNAAMASTRGEVDFYVNLDKDDWSSMDPAYGARLGTRWEKIRVASMPFVDVLDKFPTPHYIKCDIEGGDVDVLRSLMQARARPRYFSVEAHSIEYYAYLASMGYTRFKLVNQNLNWATKLPQQALEGESVEHVFTGDCSGPFGKETVGEWCRLDEVLACHQAITTIAKYSWMSNAWYDVHARLPEEGDDEAPHDRDETDARADAWSLLGVASTQGVTS